MSNKRSEEFNPISVFQDDDDDLEVDLKADAQPEPEAEPLSVHLDGEEEEKKDVKKLLETLFDGTFID